MIKETTSTTEQFDKNKDANSYTTHAEDYYQNEIILAKPFSEKMMRYAHIQPDQKILDVGTGPDILAFNIASNLDNKGSITGVDLSDDMINTSRLHAKQYGFSNAKFSVMDAENLEFVDAEFDSVVSMRTMHHIPNVEKALKEMLRVLKPNGGFSISIGSRIPPWGHGRLKSYGIAVSRELKNRLLSNLIAPNFITKLSAEYLHDIPEPLHTSWGGHAPEKSLIQHIERTGFRIEKTEWLYNIVQIETTEQFWRYQLAVVTDVRKRYQKADIKLQNKFRKRFYEISEMALAKQRNLYYCGSIFAVSGKKPTA